MTSVISSAWMIKPKRFHINMLKGYIQPQVAGLSYDICEREGEGEMSEVLRHILINQHLLGLMLLL